MTVTAPDRSQKQRLQALEHANWTRSRRKELKRDLKAGRVTIDSLLACPPAWLLTARVFDFVLYVPKYGRVKANGVFARAGVAPSRTFGGLTGRQRRVLSDQLRGGRA